MGQDVPDAKVKPMMNSIVQEALSRSGVNSSPEGPMNNSDDAELLEILKNLKTRIVIFGCGGGGSNTIERLYEEGVEGAELYAANTDAQHLLSLHAPHKILLVRRTTKGLGAGALPQIGEEAAKEAEEEIRAAIGDADMVFITAGMGGGTGTGSASVVGRIARETGALTIAFVTTPFKAEGKLRMENAIWGLENLRKNSDTVITIPNDKLVELYPRLPLMQAFKVADETLSRAIKGLTETITKPGLVNLDFNDIRTIMKGSGVAVIGIGESDGYKDERALKAVETAINSPLLDVDISNAKGVLVNVIGGPDMTISEAEAVAELLQSKVGTGARIIWGASVDPTLENTIKVMIVVTGVKSRQILGGEARTTSSGIDLVK